MPHVELPQAEFKIAMLGDTHTGKTSLVLRFAEGYYRDAPRSSTVGAFFITKRLQTSNGITCKIQIWDTAGQKQYRPMAPMYYKTAAAAIVCFDAVSYESFAIMRDWLDELHRNINAGSIVIAIAATKCDLQPVAKILKEAEDLAQAVGAIFVDTSAKLNYRVNDLFQKVAERVLRFRDTNNVSLPIQNGACVNEYGQVIKHNNNGFVHCNNDDDDDYHDVLNNNIALKNKQSSHTPSSNKITPSKNDDYLCNTKSSMPSPKPYVLPNTSSSNTTTKNKSITATTTNNTTATATSMPENNDIPLSSFDNDSYDNHHQSPPIESNKQALSAKALKNTSTTQSSSSVLCGESLICGGIFSKNNTIDAKSNSDDPACYMS